jgi:hypothetical protein
MLVNFLRLAPGKQPENSTDYQNDQEYPRPNSSLKDISNYLTASQDHSRKKQKHEEKRSLFHPSSVDLVRGHIKLVTP